MPLRSGVRYDISRIGRDRDRMIEDRLLPSARRFGAEGHGAAQISRTGPEMAHVRTAVGGASFVKPDAGNEAATVGTEFQAEFHRGLVICYRIVWRVGKLPYRQRRDRRRRRRCGK